ncbi:hypothetical protein CEUSTIGMA_g3318.t1 [Chlamydomonas eustigma]|uniref:glycerophosphodiester phosphodiesterase n=1 Tax=Chlamydomonas eustigma TaxID=1157962 RepID=A0A250WYL4_9CHLO|nr:hypothetical protein CEUSTIGMA_g3318.t1 [Chlamydomonas eustigma]|eukprot:GAX75875.1 hypothetical protein CEUSTIGMA_g3318.t1 [Chlamydomonas eustigma]
MLRWQRTRTSAGRPYFVRIRTATGYVLFVTACIIAAALYLYSRAPGESSEELAVQQHIKALPTQTFCAKPRPPLVCAHGGLASKGTAPPNTAEAFQSALRLGVDCVEVDVARTRDGSLVVLHVRELQQLVDGMSRPQQRELLQRAGVQEVSRLQVGDLVLSDILSLSWSPGGQKVLTVKEAIMLTQGQVDSVILDVKTYQDKRGRPEDGSLIAEQVVVMVHDTGCSNCLIWAKSDQVMLDVKRLSPGQRAGYIVMNETEAVRREGMHQPLRLRGLEVVGMHFGMVDSYHLQLIHAAEIQLYSWTINNASLMHQVLDVGVDALVTNEPRMVMEAIDSRLSQC